MKKIKELSKLSVVFIFLIAAVFSAGCVSESDYDTNKEVPSGEPAFPSQQVYGIVDPHHVLSQKAAEESFAILDKLKKDGIAEVTVLIQTGVKDPETYATRYGRYIGLGEKGKNNGLVWLIRPDVEPEKYRMTYSAGRGLPKLTASDLGEVMQGAADPINFGNYDAGVLSLVKGTDEKLRKLYG
ncbi:MAG: TPM domain-containing protein [Candidatus Paceibacterota bacterium]|jgi:uncharacterized membrane protein YgcG